MLGMLIHLKRGLAPNTVIPSHTPLLDKVHPQSVENRAFHNCRVTRISINIFRDIPEAWLFYFDFRFKLVLEEMNEILV